MSEKKANLQTAGSAVGKVLRTAGNVGGAVMRGAGEIGEGLAQEIGMSPAAGRLLGQAVPVAGAAYATKDVPAVRRWRIRHQIAVPMDAGARPGDY